MEESGVSLVHVDEIQDEEAIVETVRLEEPSPLHFKTTSTEIVVGQDVKDFPKVPPDWYRNKDEQTHMSEADWKYVDVTTNNGKVRQIKMGSKLEEKEIKEYSELVDEFSDTFAWSYDELRGIPREMVEHRILLIMDARPIRQKERRMNPQLQLLVRAELERLLKALQNRLCKIPSILSFNWFQITYTNHKSFKVPLKTQPIAFEYYLKGYK